MLEAERVSAISRRLGRKGRVALRINPAGEVQGGAVRMGGKPAPFGVDEECLDVTVDQLLSDSAIDFCGIHLFIGSQILDHTIILNQYHHAMEIARRIADRLQRPLQTIDLGGGFGIPYFEHEREIDMQAFGKGLAELMTAVRGDPLFSGTQIMVEPGRFLVGEAGTLRNAD